MNKKSTYISALVIFVFLFSVFSFPYFSTTKELLLSWVVIISVMGFLAGVTYFLKNQLLSIFKKKECVTPLLVIISFLCTFLTGMCNPARSWFAGKNLLSENPDFLKTVINVTLNNDSYFKDFPAKAKLNIILARMVSPDYMPSISELSDAGFDRSEFDEIFKSPGNSPDKKTLSSIFLPEDVEKFSDLSEKAQKLGPSVYGSLSKKLDSLFIWYSSLIPTVAEAEQFATIYFSSPPFSPGKPSGEKTSKPPKTAAVFKALIEKKSDWDSLSYSERENYLSKNRSEFLIKAGFSKKMPDFLSGEAGKLDKKSGTLLTASFINVYRGEYFPLKGGLRWIFRNIYKPISTAVMSLLLFFAISAVLRTFRFSSFESSVMIMSAVFVLAVQTPVFIHIAEKQESSELMFNFIRWTRDVPFTAAIRGLIIGIGIGACLLSFKFITEILKNNKDRTGM